jgi:DNA modification methylase
MWYDLDHHEKIAGWAKEIGWKVQRWPIVWCKTSTCRNSAAQYNVTKSTEVCYMFRRSERSTIKTKKSTNYILAGTAATATHPFCKPFEVWEYLITAVSVEGQTIVDPFAGEGSALNAIFKLKREPIGIEIDEKHIASGLQYLQQELNKNLNDDLLSEIPL